MSKRLLPTLAPLLLVGCGSPQLSLMDTPVIYHADGLDPLAHVDDSHRKTTHRVFYATNRERSGGTFFEPLAYDNGVDDRLHVGKARVRFGEDLLWDVLHRESRRESRDVDIKMELTDVWEHGSLAFDGLDYAPSPTDGADQYFADVNEELARAADPEILLYVHGAKVDFYNACVYAAELDHFAGRDMVSVAFAWPTHQSITAYAFGEDVERAQTSARALESFLHLLATRTTARRIHIICWSAGGRVVSRALDDLLRWEERMHEDPSAARLGLVVFAAPDVPLHDFVERLPAIERVAERVVITASDHDGALSKASLFMGGGQRMGSIQADVAEEEVAALARARDVELVDVSRGKEERGFDIRGHRYWYSHAWVSSDVILAVRTRLDAAKRGLEQSELHNVWYLPSDYPERVRAAARAALGDTW